MKFNGYLMLESIQIIVYARNEKKKELKNIFVWIKKASYYYYLKDWLIFLF